MNESFIFEVIEIKQKDSRVEIGGLVFHTIKRGDVLSVSERPNRHEGVLHIKEIVFYGRQMDEIDRGCTCWLIVENEGQVDLTQVKYLYKVDSSD
jgi:hypothetical protein